MISLSRIFLIIILGCISSIQAQNLFPNPDFEFYNDCPIDYSGVETNKCKDWRCISGSTDYYNCTFYGSQAGGIYGIPSSGKGVMGMWGLINNLYCEGDMQGEALAADLLSPLIPCETYRVTFDVRLANVGAASYPGFGHDCLDFGFFFYKGGDPNACWSPCGCWAQPQVSIATSLIPREEYITITLEFIATDAFDNVAIGPACNDMTSSGSCVSPQENFGPHAIYFNLDNIYLEHIETYKQGLHPDTVICQGDTLNLNVAHPDAVSYLWQDGSTNPKYQIFSPGIYIVEITTDCKSIVDTIKVILDQKPEVFLGNDTSICSGETLMLHAMNPNATYQWHDGSVNATFAAWNSGTHWVVVENNCGIDTDSIIITTIPVPVIELGDDITVCENEKVTLDAHFPGAQYLWQDLSINSSYEIISAGLHWVEISNYCGKATDSIYVTKPGCHICRVYVPNVFSPNLDNMNDDLGISVTCPYKSFQIRIYDRWGGLAFESDDPDRLWNGGNGNWQSPSGVYTYLVTIISQEDEMITQYGDITLIR